MAPQLLWRPGSNLRGAAAGQTGGESVLGPWRVNRERLTRSLLRGAGSPGPQPGGGSALQQVNVLTSALTLPRLENNECHDLSLDMELVWNLSWFNE